MNEIKPCPLTKWEMWEIGPTAQRGLILIDGGSNNVISLVKEPDGKVTFQEECDGHFFVTMSKDEAKEALSEALAWLDE